MQALKRIDARLDRLAKRWDPQATGAGLIFAGIMFVTVTWLTVGLILATS